MNSKHLALASLAVAVLLGATAQAEETGDAKKGQQIFNRCKVCHTLDDSGKSRIGPNLYGVVARKAGSFDDYHYSDAMKKAGESGLVWTPDKLDAYLADPRAVVPGNKMTFAGLKDAQDRKDVIAYLTEAGKKGGGQ